jgi:hypothetical protein
MKVLSKQNVLKVMICSTAVAALGCSSTVQSAEAVQASPSASADPTAKDAIKIEDIDWQAEPAVIDGDRCMSLNYTNNSRYTIMSLTLKCTLKSDLSEDQKTAVSDLKTTIGMTDSTQKTITLEAQNEKFAQPGQSVSDAKFNFEWSSMHAEYITKDVFELFDPDMMTIAYIGDDGKGYENYYDFQNDTYGSSSKKAVELQAWPKGELAGLLPDSIFQVTEVRYDLADHIYLIAHGVSPEEFLSYKDSTSEKGFTSDVYFSDNRFWATNADGILITLDYDAESENLEIAVGTI